MFNSIKKHLLKRSVQKQHFIREKKMVALEQTKSIGMICHIIDEESYKEIYDLFTKLHSHKRTVWLMGYVNKKEVPYYCLQQLAADYFANKHLNWYGKPDFAQLKDFLSTDFDILIDFSRQNLPPLQYILAASKAKLIIGANHFSKDLYDVYINEESNSDNLKLLKTFHNYLIKLTGG
jgi:hypothetical protein